MRNACKFLTFMGSAALPIFKTRMMAGQGIEVARIQIHNETSDAIAVVYHYVGGRGRGETGTECGTYLVKRSLVLKTYQDERP
jgi:hypothetical protein